MVNIDKIIKCENKYIECFCRSTEQQDFIRFRDELLPDMYYHNYTWVKSIKNESLLIQLIESEIIHSKNANKDFCLIRCHIPINESILELLSCKPEISMSCYYVFDVSNFPKLNDIMKCNVLKVDNSAMLEDILYLDLQHDEDSLGIDFCTRRVYRRKDVYLSDEGVNSYICYNNDEAVGSCDLFIFEDTAKIEDFAIAPQQQHKGYGTVMLKTLIEISLKRNVTTIYLETDEDDTAKEMYGKCGFSKVYEFTDLLFEL